MMDLFCVSSSTIALREEARADRQHGEPGDRGPAADELPRGARRGLGGPTSIARRVELHAVQAGRIWQNEVWSPSFHILVYQSTVDTIGLKHSPSASIVRRKTSRA